MAFNPRDRRVAIAGGALAAVAGAAALMIQHRSPPPQATALGSEASLQVQIGHEDPGLDPKRPMRCFVGGQFVGQITLAECATRNGVSPGSLDVGLDANGQIAAASDSSLLQPLAQPSDAAADEPAVDPGASASADTTAPCLRFSGQWRQVDDDATLDACVQTLFDGRCERPGGVSYGRWGDDSLRRVPGRVERAGADHIYRPIAAQSADDCAIAHVGD